MGENKEVVGTVSAAIPEISVRRDLIKPRNTSRFASRDLRWMIAGRRLPTAWLFIFEVRSLRFVYTETKREMFGFTVDM